MAQFYDIKSIILSHNEDELHIKCGTAELDDGAVTEAKLAQSVSGAVYDNAQRILTAMAEPDGITVNYDAMRGVGMRSGGYNTDDGLPNDQDIYFSTASRFDVVPGQTLTFALNSPTTDMRTFVNYYRADGTFISDAVHRGYILGTLTPDTSTVPADAASAVVSFRREDSAAVNYSDYSISLYINRKYEVTDLKISNVANDVSIIKNDIYEYETLFNSLCPNASVQSNNPNSPFVVNLSDCTVTGIRLSITRPGTLSVGYTTDAITIGNAPDMETYSYRSVNVHAPGVQTITLEPPLVVPAGAKLFVCLPTDTARFLYGGSGASDSGFWYVSTSMTYAKSNNFIGIDAIERTHRYKSVYAGKTLSILGDSISTFSGYIPAGNATYYPAGDVTSVDDTWWMKTIDALGMLLDVNNSWSGSRVTTTNGDESAGCMTRCQDLGDSPDVIIVYMGINDFNNEVQLGTYDGQSSVPTATTTFREAYAVMLDKVLTEYQTSEVWACTMPQCERNSPSGFPEVNGNGVALLAFNRAVTELAEAFGVKLLDFNRCGLTYQNMPVYNPDNLHPNKLGHSLMANCAIDALDPAVRKRY